MAGQAFIPEIQYKETEKLVLWTANQTDMSHLHHITVCVIQGHIPHKYPWMSPVDVTMHINPLRKRFSYHTINCMFNQYLYIYLWQRELITPSVLIVWAVFLMCFIWVYPATSFSSTMRVKISHASLKRWKKWCHLQCRCHGKYKHPISASLICNKLTSGHPNIVCSEDQVQPLHRWPVLSSPLKLLAEYYA